VPRYAAGRQLASPPVNSRSVARVLAAGCACAALAGCGSHAPKAARTAPTPTTQTVTAPAVAALPGAGRPAVTIGDKNFAEQFVLGELYKQALQAQGFSTTLDRNIGTTQVTMQALLSGRLDMYPEYLNVWNQAVAGDQRRYGTERAALDAARRHAQARGLSLLDPTPFSDTGAIVVTPAYAAANGVRTLADLAPLSSTLTIGGPPQFQTSHPGLGSLAAAYAVIPAAYKALDIGDQLSALARGNVQAAEVSSTDGQLQVGQYVQLTDPKHVFGWGNVVPVIPRAVLAAEGPVFVRTINAVTALLTDAVMRQLNSDVELANQDPAAVAKRFLQANGLVPPGP
jgi:osmoprotectant transport system substrate-binding protein